MAPLLELQNLIDSSDDNGARSLRLGKDIKNEGGNLPDKNGKSINKGKFGVFPIFNYKSYTFKYKLSFRC